MGYLAAGCKTGIVNLFEIRKPHSKLSLVKEIQNLSTSVDNVEFNDSGELLCMSSKWKKNAVRLLKMDEQVVHSEWPSQRTNLKQVTKLRFSRDSRFVVFGNDLGEVNVFRVY